MTRFMRNTQLLLACASTLAGATDAAAASDHAHVHGIAGLQVAVEGERLTLAFSSPLENLVGFERTPRTDKEKGAVRQMVERLQKPEDFFVPSPEARCARNSVKLNAPVIAAQIAANGSASQGGTPAPTKDQRAGKATESEHATLLAEITFRCEQPQHLKGLTVALFDAFPKLRRVDAQVAGAKKQTAARLTTRNRNISW